MTASSLFQVLLDTTHYSGNFERQVCAHATGQVGECEVGSEEAEQAREDMPADILAWWEEHALHQPDEDNGCRRPVAIAPTPGFFNNGMGGQFEDIPANEAAALKALIKSNRERFTQQLSSYDRVTLGQGGWTAENLAEHRARAQAEIDALPQTVLRKYPAYQSVAIFCDTAPPAEVFNALEQRAREYLQNQGITLLGVRLEEVVTTIVPRSLPRPG